MSERQAKRQRRAERRAATSQDAIPSHPPLGAPPLITERSSVASSHLAIALSAAVPLRVLGLYERQGPDKHDDRPRRMSWERLEEYVVMIMASPP